MAQVSISQNSGVSSPIQSIPKSGEIAIMNASNERYAAKNERDRNAQSKFSKDLKFSVDVAPVTGKEKQLVIERQKFVMRVAAATGMPVNRVAEINYKEAKTQKEANVLGTWNEQERKLSTWKSWTRLPIEAQGNTISHEVEHSNSVFFDGARNNWKSEEARQQVQKNIADLAKQTVITRVYLNGYHKKLCEEYSANPTKEAFSKLCIETEAITMELALHNPKHLQEVAKSQADKVMYGINRSERYVSAVDVALLTYSGMTLTSNDVAFGDLRAADRRMNQAREAIKVALEDYRHLGMPQGHDADLAIARYEAASAGGYQGAVETVDPEYIEFLLRKRGKTPYSQLPLAG